MNECSIGFSSGDDVWAGKNWEPGLGYHTLVLHSPVIDEPKVIALGLGNETIDIGKEVERAFEEGREIPVEDFDLHHSEKGERLPERHSTEHREGAKDVKGIFPSRQFASEPEDNVQYLVMAPISSEQGSFGVASPFNLNEIWTGINDEGLYVATSAIKHRGRSECETYAPITADLLSENKDADNALNQLESILEESNHLKGVNFLLSDYDSQYIVEYVPECALNQDYYVANVCNGTTEFRSNHAEDFGFYMTDDWNPSEASDVEVANFVRTVNRQLAMDENRDKGPKVFQNHTNYPEIRENLGVAAEELQNRSIGNMTGEFEGIETDGSFYTVCSHPTQNTNKRTFLNMIARWQSPNDFDATMNIGYPCDDAGRLEITPQRIRSYL